MFFIVFEWPRILESAMDKYRKWYVTQNHVLIIFSVNVSVLADVFCRQIKKTPTILPEIVGFLKIVGKIQLVRKRSEKINFDVILHYISFPPYPLHFSKFCPIQKQ